jgi:hypothetical protein
VLQLYEKRLTLNWRSLATNSVCGGGSITEFLIPGDEEGKRRCTARM